MLSEKGKLGIYSQEEAFLKFSQTEGEIRAILFRSHMRKKCPVSCFYIKETTIYNYVSLETHFILYKDTNIFTWFQ